MRHPFRDLVWLLRGGPPPGPGMTPERYFCVIDYETLPGGGTIVDLRWNGVDGFL